MADLVGGVSNRAQDRSAIRGGQAFIVIPDNGGRSADRLHCGNGRRRRCDRRDGETIQIAGIESILVDEHGEIRLDAVGNP